MVEGARLRFDPIDEAHRNWVEHGWGEADAMAAVTSLMRAQQILISRINTMLEPLGITFARYEVMVLLSFSRAGALPMGKIGQRLQVHAASVTNAIDRLESAGLVRRVAHPTDGRARLAELTESGRAVMDDATRLLVEARFGLEGLDDADAQAISSILTGLRAAAGDFRTG